MRSIVQNVLFLFEMVFKKLFVHALTVYAKSVRRICIFLYFGYICTSVSDLQDKIEFDYFGICAHISCRICICKQVYLIKFVMNFYLHLSSRCTDCSYSVGCRKECRRDLHLKPLRCLELLRVIYIARSCYE